VEFVNFILKKFDTSCSVDAYKDNHASFLLEVIIRCINFENEHLDDLHLYNLMLLQRNVGTIFSSCTNDYVPLNLWKQSIAWELLKFHQRNFTRCSL